jgi:hypothetical protein
VFAIVGLVVGPITRQAWLSVVGGLCIPVGVLTIIGSIFLGMACLTGFSIFAATTGVTGALKKPLIQFDIVGTQNTGYQNQSKHQSYSKDYYVQEEYYQPPQSQSFVVHDSNKFYESAPDTNVNQPKHNTSLPTTISTPYSDRPSTQVNK